MLGGMAGGGMGLLFDPARRDEAADWLQTTLRELQAEFGDGIPFAIEPVVYDFALNREGSERRRG